MCDDFKNPSLKQSIIQSIIITKILHGNPNTQTDDQRQLKKD
jgi:hypothetical protein